MQPRGWPPGQMERLPLSLLNSKRTQVTSKGQETPGMVDFQAAMARWAQTFY